MSIAAIGRVMALSEDLRGTPRFVLVALAWHHNEKTGQCDPAMSTLARDAAVTQRRARSAIAELVRQGLIRCHQRAGKPTQYELLTPDASVLPDGQETPDAPVLPPRTPASPDASVTPDAVSTDPGRARPTTPDASVLGGRTPASSNREYNGNGTGTRTQDACARDGLTADPDPVDLYAPSPVPKAAAGPPPAWPVNLRPDLLEEIRQIRASDGDEVAERALAAGRRQFGAGLTAPRLRETYSAARRAKALGKPPEQWPEWAQDTDRPRGQFDRRPNDHQPERSPIMTLDENGKLVPTGRFC